MTDWVAEAKPWHDYYRNGGPMPLKEEDKVRVICETCGSADLTAEYWSEWTFDGYYCAICNATVPTVLQEKINGEWRNV